VLQKIGGGFRVWRGTPVDGHFKTRFAIHSSVLSLIAHGQYFQGRIFFLDKLAMTTDDLVLGDIVSQMVVSRMDGLYLLRQVRQMAAVEERVHIARDLHDSVLQSLAAIGMQLQAARRLLDDQPLSGKQRLGAVQDLISDEQRNFRSLVSSLKTSKSRLSENYDGGATALKSMAKRLEEQWGARVDLKLAQEKIWIPEVMFQSIASIVQESIVNAVRHGQASLIQVRLAEHDKKVLIDVNDNGTGFSFQGNYDHSALAVLNLGPETLKERIAQLGGSLSVHSMTGNVRLEIEIPIALEEIDVH
jgi:signal transduction histidine kinase